MKTKLKEKTFYGALVLVVIGVLSALILASVNLVTKVDEAAQFAEKVAVFYPSATVTETISPADYPGDEYTVILSAARLSDGAVAVRAKSKKAYSSDGLELLVFLKDGIIVQVEKYRSAETPGIGSNVVSREHLNKYVGETAEKFREAETSGGTVVDGITGATKTSTGVDYAVTAAAKFYLWEAAR